MWYADVSGNWNLASLLLFFFSHVLILSGKKKKKKPNLSLVPVPFLPILAQNPTILLLFFS